MKRTEKRIVVDLLRDLAEKIQSLGEREFDDLISGSVQMEVNISPKVKEKGNEKREPISEAQMSDIRHALELSSSREEGAALLKEKCSTKEELTRLAKHLDLPVQKLDKVGQISERIIEATIGFRIRSAAIQGEKR